MMASSMLIKVTCLAVICLILGIPLANATLSCDEIETSLAPCIEYVKNPGPSVPAACCDGFRIVYEAQCKDKDLCKCSDFIKRKMPEVNDPAFFDIPNNCGLKLPYCPTIFALPIAMDCD
ncbi:hypothetical protein TSUD_161060 [Trifolium subterraneum]|uniref:Bifunctional inhibitor/plant lipid transfer protein/seed storage helical domain-containing protein n=1 Tax=Trifolium subterraneum TaxID=3900 RepID=A0A2Z6N1S4_TRISU|nr:hypothetical protein TSUD_161060 [Trifolium subterraneum]